MASQPYWHAIPEPAVTHERPVMTLLPKLEAEERDALMRQREDEEREERLASVVRDFERLQTEASATLMRLKRELRFPLDSVRVGSDES